MCRSARRFRVAARICAGVGNYDIAYEGMAHRGRGGRVCRGLPDPVSRPDVTDEAETSAALE